jgi:HEAT repeat protein
MEPGRISEKDSFRWYEQALGNPDPEVRWNAIIRLEEDRPGEMVRCLIKALNDREFISIRWRAAIALGKTGDPSAVPALISALADENDHVREEAAEALGIIGDARAIDPLIKALRDPQRGVRLRAAKALEMIGDRAEPALQSVLGTGSASVLPVVREILDTIGKKKRRQS